MQEELLPAAALPPSSHVSTLLRTQPIHDACRLTSVAGPAAGGRGRAPLPTNADGLPPIEPDFRATLESALLGLDIRLGPAVQAGIEAHVRLLMAWNVAINLTAIRDPEAIALEHVADSLTAVALIEAADLGRRPALLDLGSGAGYPGLPLGLALPCRPFDAGRFGGQEGALPAGRR